MSDDNDNDHDVSFEDQRDFTNYIGRLDKDHIREYLQKIGPNTIMSGHRFWEGYTPLTYALKRHIDEANKGGQAERNALKQLINLLTYNGADINGIDGNGNTPLLFAISRGSKDMAEFLLRWSRTSSIFLFNAALDPRIYIKI